MSTQAANPTRTLSLPENALRWRPLWPKSTAQIFLNLNEYDLEKKLDHGLHWVFNIGRSSSKCKAIRVFAYCVFECAGLSVEGITPTANLSFERIAELIFGKRPTLRSVEVARLFFCERRHIHWLTHDKDLATIGTPAQRFGPNASPKITRDSLVKFLERRRIT